MIKKLPGIDLVVKPPKAEVFLSRPELKNAFNPELIQSLIQAFGELSHDPDIRVVILSAKGDTFCSGADLNWMRSAVKATYADDLEESKEISEMLASISSFHRPVVVKVNGPALGGGIGIVAAGDIVVASRDAFFAFSEVRIGLAPAVISPYVIRRIGFQHARRLFLTGERFSAEMALQWGLVDLVVDPDHIDTVIEELIDRLLQGAPEAQMRIKELIDYQTYPLPSEVESYTTNLIATLRTSDEGQEGMTAYFEKRKPAWIIEKKNSKKE